MRTGAFTVRRWSAAVLLLLFTALPASAATAQLVQLVGQGTLESGAGAAPEPLREGMELDTGNVIQVGEQSSAVIRFMGGSEVRLGQNSRLVITDFQRQKLKTETKLDLLRGSLRAKVKEDEPDRKSSFMVRSPNAVAAVRGTEFFMNFVPGTLESPVVSEVVVLSGEVEVFHMDDSDGKGQEQGKEKDWTPKGEPVVLHKLEVSQVKADEAPLPPQAVPPEAVRQLDAVLPSFAPAEDSKSDKTPKSNKAEAPAEEGGKAEESKENGGGAALEPEPDMNSVQSEVMESLRADQVDASAEMARDRVAEKATEDLRTLKIKPPAPPSNKD